VLDQLTCYSRRTMSRHASNDDATSSSSSLSISLASADLVQKALSTLQEIHVTPSGYGKGYLY
jgi:hypothetical protein